MTRGTAGSHVLAPADTFQHVALLYEGEQEFLEGTTPFIHEAMESASPMLVVVGSEKIDALRRELGVDAKRIRFADMTQVGRNPARILPIWRDFVNQRAKRGRRVWGIGEPVWAERSPEELVECQHHEALMNLAFAGVPQLRLLCPYDARALGSHVIQEACRTHPMIRRDGRMRESAGFRDDPRVAFDGGLPEPVGHVSEMAFDLRHLDDLRRFVFLQASALGLVAPRTEGLVLAANEAATNSVRHGGGRGTLRMWNDGRSVICEVRDRGRIADPLVGRRRPRPGQESGLGLWIVNQICDLVQIRADAQGTIVRVHMTRE